MKNLFVLFVLLLLVSNSIFAQDQKTITVYFSANSSELPQVQKDRLKKESKGYFVVHVVGFANSLPTNDCSSNYYGPDDCNYLLAKERALTMLDIFESSPYANIMNPYGIEVIDGGNPYDRKAEIHLQKRFK